jgi:hypothetical protein
MIILNRVEKGHKNVKWDEHIGCSVIRFRTSLDEEILISPDFAETLCSPTSARHVRLT